MIRNLHAEAPVWRAVLRTHEENLQVADSVDGVVEIVKRALESLPGVGRGAVFFTDAQGGATERAVVRGPESSDLSAPMIELTGMARRAMRERRPVSQTGVSAGVLWAAPLQSPRGIHGAVAAVGDNEEVPGFLAHAGMALARELGRETTERKTRNAEERAEALERAVGVLDSIVRDGRSETVLRRIVGALAAVPGLGGTALWALRSEDGRYVEVARSDNGPGADLPEPPVTARRAEGLRKWWREMPRFAGFGWQPALEDDPAPRPSAGDTLFLPLPGPDGRHPHGFLLARLEARRTTPELLDDLQRWSALARLSLEAGTDGSASLARLEELREERRQVADLHRMKSQFIAAVSHELRTPLTSISAYAEALRTSPGAEEEETRERFLRVIQEESGRLARIVDDILDLATMDAGRVRLSCRRTDLRSVVADAQDVLLPIAGSRGIRISVPPPEAVEVHADPDLLKQLVVNLVENAVKFTHDDGEIRIRMEEDASAVRLIVEDDGPGIPSDELDAIFERFYQVDGTDAREHGGSGLGLAICRSIVLWHDGRIWAESEAGQGARFVASLPRVRAVSRARTDAEPGNPPAEEHRIPELIIEMISEIVRAEAVSLMLLEEGGDTLYIQAAMGVPDEAIRDVRVALGERISGRVAATGRTLLIPDVEEDDRFAAGDPDQYRTRSLLSVPVMLRGRAIGVINVTNKANGESFSASDRRLVETLSQRVALVLQKLREHGDRRDAIARMEDAMRGVIDARRHGTPHRDDHSELILDLCAELTLPEDETTRIHYASMLRDVGMAKLPAGVYRKPGGLSAADREAIRRHPEEGARAIRPIEFQSDVFDVILSHHEETDGTGYPRGLAGDGIPRGARILAVVDAFDALCHGRPHKEPVAVDRAMEELRSHAGSQFDGRVVGALESVLRRRGELVGSAGRGGGAASRKTEGPNGSTEPRTEG